MREDPLKNLSVVQAVKDVPQLYMRDTTISKQETNRLWDIVGKKVGLPGMNARDRWRIIRGSYVRYLRASETDSAPNKKYYLASYLQFLRPYLKIRDSTGAIVAPPSPSECQDYVVDEEPEAEATKRPATTRIKREAAVKNTPKRIKREIAYTDEEEEEEEEVPDEEQEEEEQQIVIEDDLNEASGGPLTYTLRNGELVGSPTQVIATTKTPLIHSPVIVSKSPKIVTPSRNTTMTPAQVLSTPFAVSVHSSEEDQNPDLLFFKSLLPQMSHWTKKQKNKFKVAVLTAIDAVDDV